MKEMLRRYLPLWIGIAVFGLAIGLPFGWGFSQFHHSSQVPREAAEPPAQAQSGQAQSPETYWGRLTTDPSAGGTLLLCLITAVLAGYTYRLFRATADLARDTRTASDAALTASTEGLLVARSALIATNRAWIHSPEVFVGSQPLLFYSKDRPSIGAQASVAIRITNVGNAPAIRVTMHTRLMAGMGAGVFPVLEQARLADEVKSGAFGLGITLFPKEVYPDNIGFREMAHIVHIGKDELDKALAANSSGSGAVVLYVVGCIDYTFPADSLTHHQTGFIRELRRKAPPFLLRPEDGDIASDDLVLIRSPMADARPTD
jgi:hypothetical protein